MSERKIITYFWTKPIPTRRFDWAAWFDGDEPDDYGQMLTGYGTTEAEAIADLHENAEMAEAA